MGRRFTRRGRWLAWAGLLILQVVGAGCGGCNCALQACGFEPPCGDNEDCAWAATCKDGRCQEPFSCWSDCCDDSECAEDQRCDDGTCVVCGRNTPCPDERPICDYSGCRGCWSDDECPEYAPNCTLEGACLEWPSGPDAAPPPPPPPPAPTDHAGACRSDNHCIEPGRPTCSPVLGACVPAEGTAPPEGLALAQSLVWIRIDGPSPFEMTRAEVTVAQYRDCLGTGYCLQAAADEAQIEEPAVAVSWADAAGFAAFVGGRLPTADEWALAAHRAESTWPWGEAAPDTEHVRDATSVYAYRDWQGPLPVCHLPAGQTPEGLCDLVGNAEEWLADTPGAGVGAAHLLVGGSWRTDRADLAAALSPRRGEARALRSAGIRVVRAPSDLSPPVGDAGPPPVADTGSPPSFDAGSPPDARAPDGRVRPDATP